MQNDNLKKVKNNLNSLSPHKNRGFELMTLNYQRRESKEELKDTERNNSINREFNLFNLNIKIDISFSRKNK